MKFSVACTFEPGLVGRLAEISGVYEVYGKLRSDCVGGGRSSYTLRNVPRRVLESTVREAHVNKIAFNYLLNAASLGGMEQTRQGQRRLRNLLDYIGSIGVDAVTVSSPLLLKLVKHQYPRFKTRISAFAGIDSPIKAKQWQDLGADVLCVSAIACNRDFKKLVKIRDAVCCELQLIANANCLLSCAHEPTHMQLLSQSSRSGDPLRGFCLDYCILHCSAARLRNPVNFIRAVWIRPEDLIRYEEIGYHNFKIVERSCPGDLLVKRVQAYAARNFAGNLLELAGQVAQIKKEQHTPLGTRLRMAFGFIRPDVIRLSSLLKLKRYGERIILHDFSPAGSPVFIDNRSLDGFLDMAIKKECGTAPCSGCGICESWAGRAVKMNECYRDDMLSLADDLEAGLSTGEHWFKTAQKESVR